MKTEHDLSFYVESPNRCQTYLCDNEIIFIGVIFATWPFHYHSACAFGDLIASHYRPLHYRQGDSRTRRFRYSTVYLQRPVSNKGELFKGNRGFGGTVRTNKSDTEKWGTSLTR